MQFPSARLRRLPSSVFVAALALVLAMGVSAPVPLRAWRDGPVRVLMSEDEYQRYGALHSDDERREFIDQFWRELDATPGATGRNFRTTFEQRCAVANARFQTIRDEGWETVRGRVFLALGEPTATRHESGGLRAIEKEVWVYAAPGDPGASLEIAFYRCANGSYRTDPSCFDTKDPSSVSFDWDRANYLRTLQDNNPGVSPDVLRQLLNQVLMNLPRENSRAVAPLPSSGGPARPPAKVADDSPASAARVLDPVTYFFRAQDGSVLAFITLELRPGPGAPGASDDAAGATYLAAASFEELGSRGERAPGLEPRTTSLEMVQTAGHFPAFFGRAYLESGRSYGVRYAVNDVARGEIIVKNAVLKVPNLGDGFSASSLVPAERFGPAGNISGLYQVGSEEVVPRFNAEYRRSELLRLYLQVYGATVDPERSMPRVDVVFRFQRSVDGTPKRFGKPFSVREAAGAAMGLALPIGDWPPGAYRVTVDLHDRVSGERVSVLGSFTILPD